MMDTFLPSFALIFLAEMGDKTQLLAMAFASRFKAGTVLAAIIAATILNHALAVVVGRAVSGFLSASVMQSAASALFILFGLWTIRGDEEDEKAKEKKVFISPFFTVASAFFIAEMGDKTQIATMTLSMKYASPVYVLAGSVLGMVAADALGIAAGIFLGKAVPEKVIKWIAAVIFILFGLAGFWRIFHSAFGTLYAAIAQASVVVAVVLIAFIIINTNGRRKKE